MDSMAMGEMGAYSMLGVQIVILVGVILSAIAVTPRICKLTKTSTAHTHEIMDNVLQRLIPLELGKEMNRIALEVLFNEDDADPETEGNA
ncbi:hypothetical protein PMAYCL1PPCAC_12227 [Pristionchus mayeri]|uniref:Uncharacterized protein n=1 Tax=Pristionchus mayeri TaxID=1317129 RepID=A0AAN5CFN8_9BILA|nr:hypothetical protein PMAYCL1PPCAC_12227 [Pristionchus mayeri]